MAELYLGLIALGVIVMATIQVAAVVVALRAARQVGEMAVRFEQDVRPIIVNLQKVSEEAARASAQAAAQVDRLDTLVSSIAHRIEDTAATLQRSILQPVRDGLALLQSLQGLIASFRAPRPSGAPHPEPAASGPPEPPAAAPHPADSTHSDDELFIG